MIQYIIQAKIDSLVAGGICAYLGLKENCSALNYCDSNAIYIIAIYGAVGLIVMEALKWGKSRLFSN